MSGKDLIDWAVKECERKKIPPHDGAILNEIRTVLQISKRRQP